MSSETTAPTADTEDNVDQLIAGATYQPSQLLSDMTTINGWDRDTILYVKKIGDLAGAYNWIHNNTAYWYSIIDYIFHFSVLLLAAPEFAGILSMLSESANNVYVTISLASIVAIGFVIGGMHVYFKFPDKISDRRSSSTRYSTIFFKVRNELIKRDDERRPADEFIDEVVEEFKDCYNESPACWSIIVRRYLLMVGCKTDLQYSELSGIQEIQIRHRQRKNKNPKMPVATPVASPRIANIPPEVINTMGQSKPKTPATSPRETAENQGTPRQRVKNTAKKIGLLDFNFIRMNKAQKQYQMDRHFIDIDV